MPDRGGGGDSSAQRSGEREVTGHEVQYSYACRPQSLPRLNVTPDVVMLGTTREGDDFRSPSLAATPVAGGEGLGRGSARLEFSMPLPNQRRDYSEANKVRVRKLRNEAT